MRKILAALMLALATSAPAATHVVTVGDSFFSPSNLTICLGDTVRWEWVDTAMGHTVTSGSGCTPNGAFDSGLLFDGASFSHVFTTIPPACASDSSEGADTCSYMCIPHCPAMAGVITVANNAAGGLGLSRNKLRVTSNPTEGRGGTTLGAESLDAATFSDFLPGTTTVTLTLSAPGLGTPRTATVSLDESRAGWSAGFPRNEANDLDIRSASIRVLDPTVAKVTIKWETNGFDLTTIGPLTLEVEIRHGLSGDCGPTEVVASDTAPVQT